MAAPRKRLSVRLRRPPTRYQPLSRIAVGGMAEVWRARAHFQSGGSHEVAIKRVLPSIDEPMLRAMFEDEARLGMLLDHPGVVRVYDARHVGGTLIMVMELVSGDSLKNILDRNAERGVAVPLGIALYVARELARALGYVHAARSPRGHDLGIIHRDVSPHNVLLSDRGAVKLTDFGLADATVHEAARSADMVGGKFGYLAPEVILRQPTDHRLDLFAAGICLWEMLAGRRLFLGSDDNETVRLVARCEPPPLRRVQPSLPSEVDALVGRMLDRNPNVRLPSGGDVADALDTLLGRYAPGTGPADVARLVGAHVAQGAVAHRREKGFALLLSQELAEFAEAAQVGAEALDPNDFVRAVESGVRQKPKS